MKAKAIQRNIHVSARKAGLVCDLIRNKKVAEAITILENCNKKTAKYLKKLLQSAAANATNNHAMIAKDLYIYSVVANQGRTIKRALPRAKGSSNMIRKRHCHLEIILSDDIAQRQKDMIEIKARLKKRVEGQHKKKAGIKSVVKTDKKASTKPELKSQEAIKKPIVANTKLATKVIEGEKK